MFDFIHSLSISRALVAGHNEAWTSETCCLRGRRYSRNRDIVQRLRLLTLVLWKLQWTKWIVVHWETCVELNEQRYFGSITLKNGEPIVTTLIFSVLLKAAFTLHKWGSCSFSYIIHRRNLLRKQSIFHGLALFSFYWTVRLPRIWFLI